MYSEIIFGILILLSLLIIINIKKIKNMIIRHLLRDFMDIMSTSIALPEINSQFGYIKIQYKHGFEIKNIWLPYSKLKTFKQHRMYLELMDGSEKDITHPSGVPYFLTARQLGGRRIVRKEVGEIVSIFDLDQIPTY